MVTYYMTSIAEYEVACASNWIVEAEAVLSRPIWGKQIYEEKWYAYEIIMMYSYIIGPARPAYCGQTYFCTSLLG
jgi:hypothetical protein